MPLVQGSTTDRFVGVRDQLQQHLDSGQDVGASVAVIQHGELVVDIWGGVKDEATQAPWERDTIVNVWSTTKTMTFLVALILSDRGEMDLFAPVERYWPEFGANDKHAIEVRHLLSHTSGLSGWHEPITPQQVGDWELSTSRLAAQAPWWDDRSVPTYHALTQGHLIGEVVRRVTGTSIGQFFKSEIADVLGADFYIGLPESEEDRVSFVIPSAHVELSGLEESSVAYRTLTSPVIDAGLPRERWWRAAEIPAANGHGNARSVASIQQIIANNGHANGHRFFTETTGNLIFQSQAQGFDPVLGMEVNIGMGYGLACAAVPVGPRACFWGGYGGSVIIMDQEFDLTIAYMMNKMRGGLVGDERGAAIAFAAAVAAAA
jgi:CubicO group peptidase (beta-lactamase class C family)